MAAASSLREIIIVIFKYLRSCGVGADVASDGSERTECARYSVEHWVQNQTVFRKSESLFPPSKQSPDDFVGEMVEEISALKV